MWLLGGGKSDTPPATIHVGSEDLQDINGTPQYPPIRVNRQDVFALHTRQQSLLEQINTLTSHLEGVNRNLALAESKMLETDLELGGLKESRNEVQRAIKTLTADSIKKIEERRQVCVREIGQLQKEYNENDSAITSLSDRLTALVSGNKEKEKAKLNLANQIATHRHAAQKLTASIRQHGVELTNLISQRSDHNLDEFTVAQLDKNLQGVHRELALGTGQLRAELESVDMLNQQVADLNSRINSNSVKLHALRRTLPEMQLVSKQNLARTKELQDESLKLEKELEAALKRLKALESGLTDLEKKIISRQQARVDATATFETLQKAQASTMMQFAELQTQQLAVATEVDKVIRQTLPTETITQAAQTCNARCVSIDKPVDGKLTATKVLMMFEETIPPDADPEQSFRLCVEVFEIVSCKMYRQKRPVETPSNATDATPKASTPKSAIDSTLKDPTPKAPQPADAKDGTKPTTTDLAAPEVKVSPKSGGKSPRSGGKRPPNAPSYLVIELKPGYHNLFAASKPSRRLSLPGLRRGSLSDDSKNKQTPPRRSSVSDLPTPVLSRSSSLSTTTSITSTTPTTLSVPAVAPLTRRRSLGSVSSIDFEFPELSPTPTTSSSATTTTTSTSATTSTTSSLPPASSATTTTTAEVSAPVTTTTITPVTETSTDEATGTVSTTTPASISTSTTSSTSANTAKATSEDHTTTSSTDSTTTTTPTITVSGEEASSSTTTETTSITTDSGTSTTSASTSTTTTETTTPVIITTAASIEPATPSAASTTTTSTSAETTSTPTIVLPTSPTNETPLESPDAGLPPIPTELETLKTQPPQEVTAFSRLKGFFAAEDKRDTVRYVFKGERHQLTAICMSFTQSLAELNKAELSQNRAPPKEKPVPKQAPPPEDDDMPAIDWALIGAVQGGPDVAVNLSAGESEILTVPQLKRLTCLAPFRSCIGGSWNLVYSLTRDGVSLSSFYHAMEGVQSSIFVIRDENKKVFGGFSNEEWRIHEGYYGSADCFVFEITQKTGLRTYRWTGGNTFFLHSTATTLAFGGGSHFALSLNSTLDRGISGPCETYGSPQLSSNHSFEIRLFEVWGILPDPDD